MMTPLGLDVTQRTCLDRDGIGRSYGSFGIDVCCLVAWYSNVATGWGSIAA